MYLSIYLFIYLFIHLFIYLFIYSFIYLFIYLFILSIYISSREKENIKSIKTIYIISYNIYIICFSQGTQIDQILIVLLDELP